MPVKTCLAILKKYFVEQANNADLFLSKSKTIYKSEYWKNISLCTSTKHFFSNKVPLTLTYCSA